MTFRKLCVLVVLPVLATGPAYTAQVFNCREQSRVAVDPNSGKGGWMEPQSYLVSFRDDSLGIAGEADFQCHETSSEHVVCSNDDGQIFAHDDERRKYVRTFTGLADTRRASPVITAVGTCTYFPTDFPKLQ